MELLIVLTVVSFVLVLIMLFRTRSWRKREDALRDLLDGADAVEQRLHECREQMTALRNVVAALPGTMGSSVLPTLDSDASVQNALKDVLAHRLWIAKHAASASLAELHNARSALFRSRDQLGEQLQRLRNAGAELRQASERHEASVAAFKARAIESANGSQSIH